MFCIEYYYIPNILDRVDDVYSLDTTLAIGGAMSPSYSRSKRKKNERRRK